MIDRVSRALHALNMLYAQYHRMQGVSDGVFACAGEKFFVWGYRYRRIALKYKTQALIEHDRVLTGL